MTSRKRHALALTTVVLIVSSVGYAQRAVFDRLPSELLDVRPPSARVSGAPGTIRIQDTSCPSRPASSAEIRRRIVDVTVQEWGFFGFPVVDQTKVDTFEPRSGRSTRRFRWLDVEEAAHVADSIAGYWTVTPEGAWILDRQNQGWNGPEGVAARWRHPWSAAFVSWVMCEAGLGDPRRFQRAVAHHVYIDQAIRARDDATSRSAFAAYDRGEAVVRPGDLLCSARRPAYRAIAERRRQIGEGARTHCDIVVKIDEANERILAIGGNVRGRVSLKLLPAVREQGKPLHVADWVSNRGRRMTFAHLKLLADPIEANALDSSPTIRALGCAAGVPTLAELAAGGVLPAANRC